MKNQSKLATQESFGFADPGGAPPASQDAGAIAATCHAALRTCDHAGGEDATTKPEPTSPGGPRSAV